MIFSSSGIVPKRYLESKALAIGILSTALVSASLYGQDDEEVFVLSPFTVDSSQDVGYRATNSTGGTSLNSAIKDIPMSIEVINKDFLDDVGATSFDEALAYSSGVFTEENSQPDVAGRDGVNAPGANEQDSADRSPSSRGGLGGRFDNVVIIRGFNVPFQNRDGFRYGGLIADTDGVTILGGILDTSNIERMEVVRGPNSLLYGIGVLSGIVNVVAKKPLSVQSGSFDLSVGNYGYFRSTLDVTGPLLKEFAGGQLNYRVAATHSEKDHWTDYRGEELDYYVAQLQYESEKLTVFLEGQYAEQEFVGIGDQFLYDNTNAAVDQSYRNMYGEQYDFSRDFDSVQNADGSFTGTYNANSDSVSEEYRITGPDTYERREETNLLLNADYTPFENFTISAGVFMTDADEERLDVNLSTLTNQEREIRYKDGIRTRDQNANYAFADELDDFRTRYATEYPNEHVDDGGLAFFLKEDYRLARYWWTKKPESTTSEQYRLRMTYEFETNDFLGKSKAKHTFLVGRHDIRDEARIVTGTENIGFQYSSASNDIVDEFGNVIPQLAELAYGDPLMFRSIFDKEPIRFMVDEDGDGTFEPSKTAVPGTLFKQTDLWFTGHYALYQGTMMNDKLGVILGARHDRYHSRNRAIDRFDDSPDDPADNETAPVSTFWWDNPDNESYGFSVDPADDYYLPSATAAEKEVTTTIALNYKISDEVTVYAVRAEGLTPNTGEVDGNYEGIPSETSTSYEVGVKFDLWNSRLSGTLSFYKIERDNAIWRFTNAPAKSRWPILVADPDGGTGYSSFRPDPTASTDHTNGFAPEFLDVVGVSEVFGDIPTSEQAQINYEIDNYYFEQDGIELGTYVFFPEGATRPIRVLPKGLQGTNAGGGGVSNPRQSVYLQYANLDEPVIDNSGDIFYEDDGVTPRTWRYYLEQAFADTEHTTGLFNLANGPDDFDPMLWDRDRNGPDNYNTSLSNSTGANVTYSDESTGVDLNLIYSITRNWQAIISYAHTQREATSPFQLVDTDFTDANGVYHNFGTEYDIWVRTFGREAFGLTEHKDENGNVTHVTKAGDSASDENRLGLGDVSPLDLIGGIQGTSLYFGAEDSASFWTKYSITEGKFKNLAFGIGAVYTGPTATSIPIGGDTLGANRYGTPPTKERIRIDASMNYQWQWEDLDFRARLNVYNATDETKAETFATYEDIFTGETITRRTVKYYEPITARLSLSVLF